MRNYSGMLSLSSLDFYVDEQTLGVHYRAHSSLTQLFVSSLIYIHSALKITVRKNGQ